VVCYCEHCNEPLGSIEMGNFLATLFWGQANFLRKECRKGKKEFIIVYR
jgi:hypothetical protein